MPFHDIRFACNHAPRIIIRFEPDKAADAVAAAKARKDFVLVLIGSTNEIIRHAEIQRAVSLARQKIDKIAHRFWPWIPGPRAPRTSRNDFAKLAVRLR